MSRYKVVSDTSVPCVAPGDDGFNGSSGDGASKGGLSDRGSREVTEDEEWSDGTSCHEDSCDGNPCGEVSSGEASMLWLMLAVNHAPRNTKRIRRTI